MTSLVTHAQSTIFSNSPKQIIEIRTKRLRPCILLYFCVTNITSNFWPCDFRKNRSRTSLRLKGNNSSMVPLFCSSRRHSGRVLCHVLGCLVPQCHYQLLMISFFLQADLLRTGYFFIHESLKTDQFLKLLKNQVCVKIGAVKSLAIGRFH